MEMIGNHRPNARFENSSEYIETKDPMKAMLNDNNSVVTKDPMQA
jgi:hypothetical protein